MRENKDGRFTESEEYQKESKYGKLVEERILGEQYFRR